MLTAISPIDGRYASKTTELQDYFSEYALIKYRVFVEIEYFAALVDLQLPQLADVKKEQLGGLATIFSNFNPSEAAKIKAIEKITNHDVKAVEYYLKDQFDELGLTPFKEFIHFGLTSQDINNTAIPYALKAAIENIYEPLLAQIIAQIHQRATTWQAVPMLARTHGQPASPTTLGREWAVFHSRLQAQLELLKGVPYTAKFGGATGGMNAHFVTYPDLDWQAFATAFVHNKLGLKRAYPTTQIEHYDHLAALFQALQRINTILIDFCRDIWTYISMDYFGQKVIANEVGSSAMPHKVNPIDFENAEGNLGIANAIFGHLAAKLPISRLQRDLTDSTVLRNIGVPIAHTQIAFKSILKGIQKLILRMDTIEADLENNWMVVAEGIQNILRREGFDKPYEALKALTRGKAQITQADMHAFIEELDVSIQVKSELKAITPFNYIGKANFS